MESCQVMQDTRTAVVTFTEEGGEAAPSRGCCAAPPWLTSDLLSHSCRRSGAPTFPRHPGAEVSAPSQSHAGHQRTDEPPPGAPPPPSFPLHLEKCDAAFFSAGAHAGLLSDGAAEGNPGPPGAGGPPGPAGNPLPEGQQRWRRSPAVPVQPAGSLHAGRFQRPQQSVIAASSAPSCAHRKEDKPQGSLLPLSHDVKNITYNKTMLKQLEICEYLL